MRDHDTAPRRRQSISEPAAPQRPGPSDATFRNYGRTPFVDASTDAVSTFSLDTDRTSYYLALTWAQNGYTVEPDSVRAEEWVNAFAYDYDAPRHGDSFAITSDVVEHPLGDGRHIARIAFQAPEVRDDTPLNVTLVLDASGSMSSGNRVDIARAAAEAIRQSLSDRDRIAVVHFTTDVIRSLTVEHSRPDDGDVARSIRRLEPNGSTNVQAGLDLGVRLADDARRERPHAYNYIILMSDGVANVDATNPFAILESAHDADNRNPLRLITIGVGIDNYNDSLLEQLAQHGNGWYRYLDDTAQARETFSRQNWLALSTPFADQARAQVTWDPRLVQSWRIIGYENRITPDHTFEQNRREFAELPSGTATTVFYELFLRPEARSGRATLGEVEVRWVDPSSGNVAHAVGGGVGDARTPRSTRATGTCASAPSWRSPRTATARSRPRWRTPRSTPPASTPTCWRCWRSSARWRSASARSMPIATSASCWTRSRRGRARSRPPLLRATASDSAPRTAPAVTARSRPRRTTPHHPPRPVRALVCASAATGHHSCPSRPGSGQGVDYPSASGRPRRSCGIGVPREDRPHGRNQVVGDYHHRVGSVLEGRFVLGNRLVLGLRLVVLKDVANACFIPPRREPVHPFAHLLLPLIRRR